MTLRVVQVNGVVDPARRNPDALLEAWWTLPRVAEATASAGADVVVVQASHAPARFTRRGIRYRFESTGARSAKFAPLRLARAVREERPDIVHLNGLDSPVLARMLAASGAPLIVQDHAGRVAGRFGAVHRWGHGRLAAATFTAAAQADPFFGARQLPAGLPIFAIPECSSDFTPGSQAAARRKTGVSGDPALLWVGHLDANKDPLTILRAAAIALETLPALELWCAFSGTALLDEVETLLRANPALAARTHLLGRVPHDQIEQLGRACDFYVSGSHREGSGYALIEALACGLPPIATDIASYRALTGDGAIGALAPPGDVEGFARAIVRLAAQPRAAARREVRAHFDRELSFDRLGQRLMAAYRAIVERRAA